MTPQWPQYNSESPSTRVWMNFSSASPEPLTDFKSANCDLWDSIGYYREPGILLAKLESLARGKKSN